MTTPKEKALELAIKFTSTTDVVKPNKGSIKMALIAVDEILEILGSSSVLTDNQLVINWEDIKSELEKL